MQADEVHRAVTSCSIPTNFKNGTKLPPMAGDPRCRTQIRTAITGTEIACTVQIIHEPARETVRVAGVRPLCTERRAHYHTRILCSIPTPGRRIFGAVFPLARKIYSERGPGWDEYFSERRSPTEDDYEQGDRPNGPAPRDPAPTVYSVRTSLLLAETLGNCSSPHAAIVYMEQRNLATVALNFDNLTAHWENIYGDDPRRRQSICEAYGVQIPESSDETDSSISTGTIQTSPLDLSSTGSLATPGTSHSSWS